MTRAASIAAALLLASACSQDPAAPPADGGEGGESSTAAGGEASSATPAPGASSSATPAAGSKTLRPEGLGTLRIGGKVPASWPVVSGGSDGCRDLAAEGYPGVYAIYADGAIRRISARIGSGITIEDGIGPGSTQQALTDAIPGLRSEPHKYLGPPANYMTVPYSGDGPTLRFEIDMQQKIALMSAGLMPQLAYVEGCG